MRDVDQGPGHPGRAVVCDGTEYPTMTAAIKVLRMSTLSLRMRCLSDDYPDWYFVDDGNLMEFEKEDIKKRHKEGQSMKSIADDYQMSEANIGYIIRGK